MTPELEALVERRRVVVQKFLDENFDLFATTEVEREQHLERCNDDECDHLAGGTQYLDGWVLILRTGSLDDRNYEAFEKLHSDGLRWSGQKALIAYAEEALG